jgi:copper(I)-binding protein
MRRPDIKKISIALTTAALALSLTACTGAGPNAATRLIKQVTDGVDVVVNKDGSNVAISNFLLVATEDGSAVVVGTIVNHSPEADALISISVANVAAAISGEVNLLQDKPIRFEGEQATSKALFDSVGARAGNNVPVVLTFARAGVVKLNAIIRDKRDTYAGVTK